MNDSIIPNPSLSSCFCSRFIFLFLLFSFTLYSQEVNQNNPVQQKSVYSFPILDAPFNTSRGSIRTEYNSPVPSMEQSLHLTKNTIQLSHRALYYGFDKLELMNNNPGLKRLGLITFDFLFYSIPIPLNISWLHEEWHRAVMGNRNISSFNDVYTAKPFSESISVSHVKDSELARIKKDHPAEMVRLSAAGMESQTYLNLQLRKDTFFYGTESYLDVPTLWINTANNIGYLQTCSGRSADKFTIKINLQERNVAQRDFVGLDCNAWVYDLFRPNEPYEMRGTHPSGMGIDRYIKYNNETNLNIRFQNSLLYGSSNRHADLTRQEQNYLNQQYRLSYLNLLNPALLGFARFSAINPYNGKEFYWNFGVAHFLTSFGYSIDLQFFLKQDNLNLILIYHTYINAFNKLPGLEAEIVRYPVIFFGKNVFLNLGLHLWLQPSEQKFWTSEKEAGGLVKVTLSFPLFENLEVFISPSIKSRGWVAGNIYLEKATEFRFGVNLIF